MLWRQFTSLRLLRGIAEGGLSLLTPAIDDSGTWDDGDLGVHGANTDHSMLDQLLPFLRTGGPMGTAAVPGTGLTNPVTRHTVDSPLESWVAILVFTHFLAISWVTRDPVSTVLARETKGRAASSASVAGCWVSSLKDTHNCI